MAVKGGPRIPKDGLVLSLDAANSKSFRGEPTTNLVSSPKSITTGWTSAASSTRTDNQTINFDGTLTAGLVSSSAASWVAYIGFSNGVSGNQYTVSFYVKGGTTTSVNFNWGGSHQGNRTTFDFNFSTGQVTNLNLQSGEIYGVENIGKNWWKVYYSTTLSNSGYCLPQISTQSGTFFIGALQIELKPYATPFVNGTRGSTVATGGGWADMTNDSNHGELINGTTYDSGSLGALSFDGVNDYIDLGSNIVLSNECTFLIWFNSSNTSQLKYLMCKAYNTGYARDFFVGITSNARIDVWFGNSSSEYLSFTSPSNSYLINTWNSLAVTRDGSTCKVFINGVEKASVSYSFTQNDNGHSLCIGGLNGSGGTRAFNGKVASAQIYNRALTEEEIKNIYAATRGRFGL